MSESAQPLTTEAMLEFASRIRQASRAGAVVALDELWTGSEEEFLVVAAAQGLDDIAALQQGGRAHLYSELHMTRRYAEIAVRAACNDALQTIAETVRSDSLTYPRPTPVVVFLGPPFSMTSECASAAMEELAADARYRDIRMVTASDGSRFLFSKNHLDAAQATSMAEWLAVGRQDNP